MYSDDKQTNKIKNCIKIRYSIHDPNCVSGGFFHPSEKTVDLKYNYIYTYIYIHRQEQITREAERQRNTVTGTGMVYNTYIEQNYYTIYCSLILNP